MKTRSLLCLLALAGFLASPRGNAAVTATGLSNFEGIEEPSVIYHPETRTFTPDTFVNISYVGDATFRMFLRYRSDEWWDGDRDTYNNDRQRAEVKGLGPHQKPGDTFVYTTTWRTDPSFQASGRFCHIFQLKATDGDAGAPLVVLSIVSGKGNALLRYWPGDKRGFQNARPLHWRPNTWQTTAIRIKTTPAGSATGQVEGSENGDAFQGASGVQVYRPDATDYRPKWGLYRGVRTEMDIGDDYIEHKNISARKL